MQLKLKLNSPASRYKLMPNEDIYIFFKLNVSENEKVGKNQTRLTDAKGRGIHSTNTHNQMYFLNNIKLKTQDQHNNKYKTRQTHRTPFF